MRKYILALTAVVSLFCLTSCAIYEKITFNEDMESGQYEFEVDFSQMMDLMGEMSEESNPLSSMGPDGGMMEKVDEARDQLEAMKGIENATVIADKEAGIMSFGFDFNSINALNTFLSMGPVDDPERKYQEVISVKNGKLIQRLNPLLARKNSLTDGLGSSDKKEDESDDDLLGGMPGMGEMMTYKMIVEFKNRTVTKATLAKGMDPDKMTQLSSGIELNIPLDAIEDLNVKKPVLKIETE